ncbi:MAG TPA: glycoside hydrolase family 31 protein [Chloroflexaceae bacterium]|nr:glycoside hydrolase family 31 protein [Chloroflexaceae bacterium]
MPTQELVLDLLLGEGWWGGAIDDGIVMPFGDEPFERDLYGDLTMNQGAPLLLSSRGRFVWSDEPFAFAVAGGRLRVNGRGELQQGEGGSSLRGAFRAAARRHFPATGQLPDPRLFTAPQYNTWIELMYDQEQAVVLAYARAIVEHGFPPGVLMIDDSWQEDHGTWRFHPGRFPDPQAMITELHSLGFTVMLWVSPFVSPDSAVFRRLEADGLLLRSADGATAVRPWWNGHSALLDCTNEGALDWLHGELGRLMAETGVDGFKLDAGDPIYYRPDDRSRRPTHPNGHCAAWATSGLRYGLNELRACWGLGGQPLAQRLRDKYHSWGADGLASLIPNGLAQGLAGYAFTCPDMIGGGEYKSFTDPAFALDQELVVRYAQCAALFPMMQFSAAPWRILDAEHLACCLQAARLHTELGPAILALAEHAAASGEPIMRHMAYVCPEGGYEQVRDQFLLGDDLLVAPVLARGARRRPVIFPPGIWQGDDGSLVRGPAVQTVTAPLARLPHYRRMGAGQP